MKQIITEPSLSYSKAFIFVMDQFVKMLKLGHCEKSLCINNTMTVTYAVDGDTVIGACVYELDVPKRQGYIYIAAVDEEYRGQGVYNEIYKEVESVCKQHGIVVLNSNVHVDNIAMIKSAEKNNRKLSWYRSSKQLT